MARKIDIGSVILHPAGTNPYVASRDGKSPSGDERVALLRQYRGLTLPENWAVWDDRNREDITKTPSRVDWTGFRED